jgi:predicted ATPase
MEITGSVSQDGKFIPDNKALFKAYFKRFAGFCVKLEVTKLPKRSNPLNRYYWGVVLPMIANCLTDASGEPITVEDAHEFCKIKFNAKTVYTDLGFEVIPKSTASLSNADFLDYLTRVKQFVAEYFGVYIPEPNETPIPETSWN